MKMGEHEGRPWEHWLVSNINNTTSSKEKKKKKYYDKWDLKKLDYIC